MTPETAIKEIEEATSDLQAFAALVAVLGSHHFLIAEVVNEAFRKINWRIRVYEVQE
jgi:hypothetical protein